MRRGAKTSTTVNAADEDNPTKLKFEFAIWNNSIQERVFVDPVKRKVNHSCLHETAHPHNLMLTKSSLYN